MFSLKNDSLNPAYSLALEEYLCSLGRDEVFMLWRSEPSVILGRFNDVNQYVNIDECENIHVNIIRRNSGGGAVYHDLGNINYSFILHDKKIYSLSFFADIVIKILYDIGINGRLTFTHNDIMLDDHKISGTAQYHHNNIILHHGTLLFDSDLMMIQKLLRRSGRVANIRPSLKRDMNISEFMNALRDNICDKFMTLTYEQIQMVNDLMQRKYLNHKWNMEGIYNHDRV